MSTAQLKKFVDEQMDTDEKFHDVMYELYLLYNIKKGEEDIKNGKTLTIEQVKKRLKNV